VRELERNVSLHKRLSLPADQDRALHEAYAT
jgi:hypothetical protein